MLQLRGAEIGSVVFSLDMSVQLCLITARKLQDVGILLDRLRQTTRRAVRGGTHVHLVITIAILNSKAVAAQEVRRRLALHSSHARMEMLAITGKEAESKALSALVQEMAGDGTAVVVGRTKTRRMW